tara:strand:+ start:157 stop:543 length:387 start_codon:yes stop_codon:yes gene_type:complete
MATEILVNDGGAPARILPFTAGSTISAGDPLQLTAADEQVDACTVSGTRLLGVALTAATSGNTVNCISGRGIVVRTFVSGTIGAGNELAAFTAGYLISGTNISNNTAILLEDSATASSAPGLVKVMLL